MISNIARLIIIVSTLMYGIWLIWNGSWVLGLGIHALIMTPLLWGTLHPRSRLFGPLQTTTGNSHLWLTIDDGPNPKDTPLLLKSLDHHGIKATFFVIGQKAEAHPELIRQIYDAGHSIGNHTWSHPQASFWCKGPRATFQEIERCQKTIQAITGEAPTLFRAPVGHSNIFVHTALKRLNLKLVSWSSRGFDAVSTDIDSVNQKITDSMRPGAIILMHESTDIAPQVLQAIIAHAKAHGWKFFTPSSSLR